MAIKLNRTPKCDKVSGLDPNQARKELARQLLDGIGGYSSCDPHGDHIYAQSSNSPEPANEAAPAAWNVPQEAPSWSAQPDSMSSAVETSWNAPQQDSGFAPQPETSWTAPQQDTSFAPQPESSWTAPQQNTSFAPQPETSWAAPQQDTSFAPQPESSWTAPQQNTSFTPQPESSWTAPQLESNYQWCGPTQCPRVAIEPQSQPIPPMEDTTSSEVEESEQQREWFEFLPTSEFKISQVLASEKAPHEAADETVTVQMQEEPISQLARLADVLVACAQPKLVEHAEDQLRDPIADIPTEGIAKTENGTIEYIAHPTGTAIQPRYNKCGILMRVSFNDGSRFERSNGPVPWVVIDANGNEVKEIPIAKVSIDNTGNVSFTTLDGRKTTMHANGSVSQMAA